MLTDVLDTDDPSSTARSLNCGWIIKKMANGHEQRLQTDFRFFKKDSNLVRRHKTRIPRRSRHSYRIFSVSSIIKRNRSTNDVKQKREQTRNFISNLDSRTSCGNHDLVRNVVFDIRRKIKGHLVKFSVLNNMNWRHQKGKKRKKE